MNIKEIMSFSLSNARERPPTRAASGARYLDLPPTETNPTPARSSTSSVSALRSSTRLPWSVTCMSRSFRRTTRAKRARPSVANASRACVSDVALLCFHPCVGLNARVRAVRAPAQDVSSHTHVFFATCTHQFATHFITNKPLPNTHVRSSTAHWFPEVTRSCCIKRDVMLIPVCRATDTMPRHTTLLPAIPSRTDSRSTRPHIRDASRGRVPHVTRADGHERAIHDVRTSGWPH